MNTKVVYCSMRGHSRKIANAIAEKIEAVAYNVKTDSCEVMNEDLLVIVSGVYSGMIDPALDKWLLNLDEHQVKNAVVVMSSVTQNYDKSTIKDILSDKGINLIGEHSCYGSFLVMKFGHPNKEEVKTAAEYVNEIYNTLK